MIANRHPDRSTRATSPAADRRITAISGESLSAPVCLISLLSYTSAGRLGWQWGLKIPAQSTSYHPKTQSIPLINNIANTHSWLQDSYHAFLRYAFIRFSFFSYFLFVLYLLAGGFPGVFLVRYPATGDSLPVPTCRPIPSPCVPGPLLLLALSAGRVLTRHGLRTGI